MFATVTYNEPIKDPTTEPTDDPTLNPTIVPIEDPTNDPTVEPTTMEPTTVLTPSATKATKSTAIQSLLSQQNDSTVQESLQETITLLSLSLAVFVIALVCCIVNLVQCSRRNNSTKKDVAQNQQVEMQSTKSGIHRQGPEIRNALVVGIAIGKYGDGASLTAETCADLNVDKDLDNLASFCNFMGYEFICNERKIHWTQEEILTYLRDDVGAIFFSPKGKAIYDGLLVCVSGHGVRDHVVTSQLEYVEKSTMYRCICDKFPQFIEIPRIFIFDACAGGREKRDSFCLNPLEEAKVHQVVPMGDSDDLSVEAMATPKIDLDRNAALIHAANEGYQAKMRGDIGPYLLYSFMERVRRNVVKHEQKGLQELMGEIQEGLHKMGRQQTVNVFNTNTRNLKLEAKTGMTRLFE